MDASTGTISIDEAFRLLADRRRRQAIRYLQAHGDGAVSVDELAAGIADLESAAGDGGEDAVRRTAIELHHAHLPKLADADLVDFDVVDATVSYRSHAVVEDLLRAASESRV